MAEKQDSLLVDEENKPTFIGGILVAIIVFVVSFMYGYIVSAL